MARESPRGSRSKNTSEDTGTFGHRSPALVPQKYNFAIKASVQPREHKPEVIPEGGRLNKNRKNSSSLSQKQAHATWAEEQRANVQQTYLRPFKLLQNGEVVHKNPHKAIKSGKLVALPHVTRNKDPILAQVSANETF